jgi:hypothetical protein
MQKGVDRDNATRWSARQQAQARMMQSKAREARDQ